MSLIPKETTTSRRKKGTWMQILQKKKNTLKSCDSYSRTCSAETLELSSPFTSLTAEEEENLKTQEHGINKETQTPLSDHGQRKRDDEASFSTSSVIREEEELDYTVLKNRLSDMESKLKGLDAENYELIVESQELREDNDYLAKELELISQRNHALLKSNDSLRMERDASNTQAFDLLSEFQLLTAHMKTLDIVKLRERTAMVLHQMRNAKSNQSKNSLDSQCSAS